MDNDIDDIRDRDAAGSDKRKDDAEPVSGEDIPDDVSERSRSEIGAGE